MVMLGGVVGDSGGVVILVMIVGDSVILVMV